MGLNADVKFLLLGDFRQLPAVLDSWAGRPIVGAQPARPRPDRRAQARAHGEHALRPRRLQLREVAAGRRGGVPHAAAGQGEAEGALPLQARVAGHHAGHQPQQAHGRERSGEPGPGAGGLKAPRVGDTRHPHRFGLLRFGTNPKQPAEHGRREDTQGRLCGRGGSGAGRSEAGQRHAAEEPGAAAGHPAEPRSYLRQLPGAHPPQPRPPGPGVLPAPPRGPQAPSCWRPRTGSTAPPGAPA